MSWSVSAVGTPADVKAALADQFKYPLDPESGLSIADEKETVRRVSETINQILDTFDPAQQASVSASGHWGSSAYDSEAGRYQSVSMSLQPYNPPVQDPAPSSGQVSATDPSPAPETASSSTADPGSDPASGSDAGSTS